MSDVSAPGRFESGAFVMPVRVYYADTDAGGVVYHGRYLDYAERARSELLRALGWPLVAPTGEAFLVRSAACDWLRPARLDELLEVRTTVSALGAATATMRQEVSRDGAALFEAEIRLAHVSAALRPARIPPALRAAFSRLGG